MGRVLLAAAVLAGAALCAWAVRSGGGAPTPSPSGDEPAGRHEAGPTLEGSAATGAESPSFVPEVREGGAPDRDPPAVRTALVRVETDERRAAEGITVVAIPPSGAGDDVQGVTDASGVARLSIPWSRGGRIVVRRGGGSEVASIPLGDGTASPASEARLFVRSRRVLNVRVRRRGDPTLPRPFRILVDGRPLPPLRIEEADAFVQVEFQPMPATTCPPLTFEAAGVRSVTLTLPPETANTGEDVYVDLEPAGPVLDVEVLGDPDLAQHVMLFRLREEPDRWVIDRSVPTRPDPGDPRRCTARVEGLPAGLYRASVSGPVPSAREEVEVRAGAPGPLRLSLDISRAGWASGRIDVPPGVDPGLAQVWTFDVDASGTRHTGMASGGPTFRIPVPGDRPVLLQVRHPQCFPHPTGGTLSIVAPTDGLVLRLERGLTADVRLEAPDDRDLPPGTVVQVCVMRGGTENPQHSYQWCPVEDGLVRFGGWEPGVVSIAFDDGRHAPLLLEGVELSAAVTHLGIRRLEAGRSIHVRAVVADGQAVPALAASAEMLGVGHSVRREGLTDTGGTSTRRHPSSVLHLRGLAAGRYRVVVHGAQFDTLPPAKGLTQIVELGADEDAEILVDFRPGVLEDASR